MEEHLNNINMEPSKVLTLLKPVTRKQYMNSCVFFMNFQIKTTYHAWNDDNWETKMADRLGCPLNLNLNRDERVRRDLKMRKIKLFDESTGCLPNTIERITHFCTWIENEVYKGNKVVVNIICLDYKRYFDKMVHSDAILIPFDNEFTTYLIIPCLRELFELYKRSTSLFICYIHLNFK